LAVEKVIPIVIIQAYFLAHLVHVRHSWLLLWEASVLGTFFGPKKRTKKNNGRKNAGLTLEDQLKENEIENEVPENGGPKQTVALFLTHGCTGPNSITARYWKVKRSLKKRCMWSNPSTQADDCVSIVFNYTSNNWSNPGLLQSISSQLQVVAYQLPSTVLYTTGI